MGKFITKFSIAVVSVFFIVNIILYYPATYLKEDKLNVNELKEGLMSSQIELYDLNTIVLFDDKIWCLNTSKNCVMVFSKEGVFYKIFYLPGIKDKGISLMYIYHNQLCVLNKRNVLYQFASEDEYKKILLKGGKEVQIFDKQGRMTDKMILDQEYDMVLLYTEDQCYLNKKESDEITVYGQSGEKGKEKIDYEKLTNYLGNKRDSSEGATYQIKGINNKIIKVKEGKKIVLRKSDIGELLFLSDDMHLVMIILLIIIQFVRYFLQRMFSIDI